ncbi:MAG TPA: hypothetical protein VFR38_15790 [Gaiellaceae bacterium]|nr:hypothetical protein [Gaiellaceae bacterium]
MPTFARSPWRLRVEGLVERTHELTYDALRALPRLELAGDESPRAAPRGSSTGGR